VSNTGVADATPDVQPPAGTHASPGSFDRGRATSSRVPRPRA
jgi:hypothetical protein